MENKASNNSYSMIIQMQADNAHCIGAVHRSYGNDKLNPLIGPIKITPNGRR